MDFEKYLDKALEIGTKAVTEQGQQAWEMTLALIRLDAFRGCLAFIFFVTLGVYITRKSYIGFQEWWDEWDENSPPMRILGLGLGGLLTFIGLLQFSFWKWIGLFYPEILLAKLALDKVL